MALLCRTKSAWRPTYRAIRVQPIHNELGSQGKSGDPSYNAETEREALRLTLDELGIASAHFAGWSGGGRALIEFALVYTDRVRSLTLIEPAARWILERLGEGDRLVDEVGDFIRGLEGRDVTEDDLAQFVRSLASSALVTIRARTRTGRDGVPFECRFLGRR